jgi:hypothetical protein
LAAGLLTLVPRVHRRAGLATLLAYLQLPTYMMHQYEEHGHGAFQREMNALLPPSIGRLTDGNIFLSNILGVWASDAVAVALATKGVTSAALLPPYLAALNAFLHIATSLRLRRYNPGLVTAVALFLPLGIYSIHLIGRDMRATRRDHAISLVGALILHLGVLLLIAREREVR